VAKGKSYWRIAGSRNRRPGALYIVAQDMSIETITLNLGELALGYTLFKGYITSSIYFRFTIPENQLDKVKKDRK
jgi:HlyD family secretion protein